MDPRFYGRFGAAENPADLRKAEVLFEPKGEKGAVSPSKTEERPPHLLALDVSKSRGGRIRGRSIGASVTERGEQTPALVNRQVDSHSHQPGPLIRALAEPTPVLPQSEKRFMTNLLSDVGIEDHEVNRADDERIEAAVECLERPAAVVGFDHVTYDPESAYTTAAPDNRFNRKKLDQRPAATVAHWP